MKKFFLILIILILLTLTSITLMNKTIIKADKVSGHQRNQDVYKVMTMNQDTIPSTHSQIVDMFDNTALNIDYLIIYEENLWFKEKRKTLKILRFERDFPPLDYEMSDAQTTYYYKLVDEIIDDIDENHSIFIRLYEKYTYNHRLWSLEPKSIVIPKTETTIEGKQKINEIDADFLSLLPFTIVETELLNRWEKENYDATNDYTSESPERLTITDLISKQH